MPNANEPRLILAVPARDELDRDDLRKAYEDWNWDEIDRLLKQRLDKLPNPDRALARQFEVVALPSNAPIPQGLEIPPAEYRKILIFGIVMSSDRAAAALAKNVREAFGDEASVGADLPVNAAQDNGYFWSHWCPEEAGYGLFGDRAAALRTMRAEPAPLADAQLPGEQHVNIVFVDTGLPPALLPPAGAFRGWPVLEDPSHFPGPVRLPGDPLTPHGEMVARNALAVARVRTPPANPNLRLLDCPAIPDGIIDFPTFLLSVAAALYQVWGTILWQRVHGPYPNAGWVICNAWGVFDPTLESTEVPYANNPLHPVARVLKFLENLCADIVFAAGNCGQFCPNDRCHQDYTGPDRNINGANALDAVLTVGAVRIDKLWLGYSGQGPGITEMAGIPAIPGRPRMAHDKPDLCAPSQFANEDDAGPGPNTGTSAACGLAAGAVALLRTKWSCDARDPARLRSALQQTAVQPYGPPGWQDRTGHGILDLPAADVWLNTHP
jgi:hypothetical protein